MVRWHGRSPSTTRPNQAALDAGLNDWVNRLKSTAETKTGCTDHRGK
jgi:hypothetical protein